jgi:UrcA family protein
LKQQPRISVERKKQIVEQPKESAMRTFTMMIFATLMGAAPAVAQQAGESRQARVSYADINIASEAGMLALRHRIEAASRTLCGPAPDLRDLNRDVAYRTCVQQSLQRALDEVPKGRLASR